MVAYCALYIMIGVPVLFMEVSIGQYTQIGCFQALPSLMPIMKGNFYDMILANSIMLKKIIIYLVFIIVMILKLVNTSK